MMHKINVVLRLSPTRSLWKSLDVLYLQYNKVHEIFCLASA